jgi:hypothetical protein
MRSLADTLLKAPRMGRMVLFAMVASGCLLPQDDALIPDVPKAKNRYPRIIKETLLPGSPHTIEISDQACKQTDFGAFVEDPDIGDVINVRWFVEAPSDHSGPVYPDTISPSSTPIRNTRVTARREMLSALLALELDSPHKVELWIADGTFGQGVETLQREERLSDGGTIKDLTYTDTYTWSVTVKRVTTCAQ